MKQSALPDFTEVRGRHLLVAVSGGADSVALLCLLAQARESLGLTLSAAHIDHCIRGEESRGDAEFCRQLCARLDVPFLLAAIDVPALARESGEGLETAARRLRYEALRRMLGETGAELIALAHHLDDQAETVLMHLLRGCGPEGIGGMDVLSGDLYRPLLFTPKRTLENWLRERNIPWRTDATNFEPFTARNSLRLHGLPALEESYPSAAEAIARYAEAARCENRFMQRMTDAFLAENLDDGPYGVRLRNPDSADEAILRRAIRIICKGALTHEQLTGLTALCAKARGRMEISGTLKSERTPGAVYFLPKQPALPEPAPIVFGGETRLDGVGVLRTFPSKAQPVRDNPQLQVLRRDALEGAVLRTRMDGDRIRPLGSGDRLLSDYLTDRKIDRPLRDFIPLVAVGNRVLWVIGEGISEDAKLRTDADNALALEWLDITTLDKTYGGEPTC